MTLLCPDCKNPVEVLKACGCNDYFCNHCNQLVSKRKVIDSETMKPLENTTNPDK